MPSGTVRFNAISGNESYSFGMGSHPDVLVIGGGVIGLTSAYCLAKAGLTVEVIEQGEIGREASWAGAGILPPGQPTKARLPIDRLRAESTSQFADFSAQLREETGIDNGYSRCGGIELVDDDDLPKVIAPWTDEDIAYEILTKETLSAIESNVVLPPGMTAIHLPDFAQVRNPWHLRALKAACEQLGVKLHEKTPFIGWGLIRNRVVTAQTADAARRSAGVYLLTGGAWSGPLLRPLGIRPPVRPLQGQIVLYPPFRGVLTRILMLGKRYLVPRPSDGRILVGSTEDDVGFIKTPTPEGIEELCQFARALIPELRPIPIETCWAGLRPATPDGLPYLGVVPGYPNVFAAVGHHRAGIQLSLATAQVMTALIRREAPPVPVESFRLDREPNFSQRPAFRS
jgi:glycine oxidase